MQQGCRSQAPITRLDHWRRMQPKPALILRLSICSTLHSILTLVVASFSCLILIWRLIEKEIRGELLVLITRKVCLNDEITLKAESTQLPPRQRESKGQ